MSPSHLNSRPTCWQDYESQVDPNGPHPLRSLAAPRLFKTGIPCCRSVVRLGLLSDPDNLAHDALRVQNRMANIDPFITPSVQRKQMAIHVGRHSYDPSDCHGCILSNRRIECARYRIFSAVRASMRWARALSMDFCPPALEFAHAWTRDFPDTLPPFENALGRQGCKRRPRKVAPTPSTFPMMGESRRSNQRPSNAHKEAD